VPKEKKNSKLPRTIVEREGEKVFRDRKKKGLNETANIGGLRSFTIQEKEEFKRGEGTAMGKENHVHKIKGKVNGLGREKEG